MLKKVIDLLLTSQKFFAIYHPTIKPIFTSYAIGLRPPRLSSGGFSIFWEDLWQQSFW